MYLDDKLLVISETSPFPGSHGDSCANTARWQVLSNGPLPHCLTHFFVEGGQVRHPKLEHYEDDKGVRWGVTDFSVDQWIALFVACMLFQPLLAKRMLLRLEEDRNRVGDGSFPNLLMVSCIRRAARNQSWVSDLPILFHAIFSRFPWRWGDSKKAIEQSTDSSADYLNWFMCIAYAHKTKSNTLSIKLSKLIISKSKMLTKATEYLETEPNSAWLLDHWSESIKEVYG